MTTTTSRRAVLAGAATLATGAAVNVAAIAATRAAPASGDSELRRLWSEYLMHADAYAEALEKYEPARAAFDAEYSRCPRNVSWGHHFEPLWEKHGLEPLDAARNAADDETNETIAAIRRAQAEGLFGVGVKLAALPNECDPEDYEEAIAAALQDINRLIGSDFEIIVDDEDDDAAVQS
jgi:hypothetical protein